MHLTFLTGKTLIQQKDCNACASFTGLDSPRNFRFGNPFVCECCTLAVTVVHGPNVDTPIIEVLAAGIDKPDRRLAGTGVAGQIQGHAAASVGPGRLLRHPQHLFRARSLAAYADRIAPPIFRNNEPHDQFVGPFK